MKKVKNIRIVSLSSGVLGEKFVAHELEIGLKRLKSMGLNVSFGKNSMLGIKSLKENPKLRAEDLLDALKDENVDMIMTAIGGEDTIKLAPFLFENDELKNAIENGGNKKIFLGFSDTTTNHLMLYKLGLNTFYGQAFLPDIAELSNEMLEYTRKYFEELIEKGSIEKIEPAKKWYLERKDFSEKSIGVDVEEFKNDGFILLKGSPRFEGEILGGCIDTMYNLLVGNDDEEDVKLTEKYKIFPEKEIWKNKILLLETSENKVSKEKYKKMLNELKKRGIFEVINGIIVGKPQDEIYFEEYKEALLEVCDRDISILYNINVGHAKPRCIIPFGVHAICDAERQIIEFNKLKA